MPASYLLMPRIRNIAFHDTRQVPTLGAMTDLLLSLVLFAYLLTLVPSDAAGRAYAAYGGIYIVASLAWLWAIEGVRPDRWDMAGAALCLIGAAIILFGPRSV